MVALVTLPEVDEVSCAGGRTGTSGAGQGPRGQT